MAVEAQATADSFVASGQVVPRAIPFPYADPAHIRAWSVDGAGAETELLEGRDYTLTGDGRDASGFFNARNLIVGSTIRLQRHTALKQEYVPGNGVPLQSRAIERALDDTVMAVQEVQRDVGDVASRALLFPFGENARVLPSAVSRSSSYLAFDANGDLKLETPENFALPAQSAADRAEAASAMAEALVGPAFANTSAGIAATSVGDWFAVNNGDGTVTIWRHNASGTAVDPRSMMTSAALANGSGSGFVGFLQSGSGAALRTMLEKARDVISVKDFGAPTNGTSDAYPAFKAAFDAAPFGATIKVPQVAGGGYYLSANPDNRSKSVVWDFDNGVKLEGPGIGNPHSGGGTFGSFFTNPWLRVDGRYKYQQAGRLPSPRGGAVSGDAWEHKALTAAENYKDITGTITNGSSVMTAVSDTIGIYPGDAILAVTTITDWPTGSTRSNAMRVVSVDHVNKTITFGPGTASGTGTATNWAGATTAAASFKVRRRHWYCGWYTGNDTGTVANIDAHYEAWNPVMNITGAAGVIAEFNLNSYALTSDWNRALFITGGGHTNNTKLIAVDIQRGEVTQWATGISIRHAQLGLFLNAKYPISIDTNYSNLVTGSTEAIGYGIHFNNSPAIAGGLLEGQQLTNGSSAITLWRQTDTGPTGKFINCKNAANNSDLFFVNIDGSIRTYAPSNSNGSTTNSGSIECNGITLRGGCYMQLGHSPSSKTLTHQGKYITFYGPSGSPIYVPAFE